MTISRSSVHVLPPRSLQSSPNPDKMDDPLNPAFNTIPGVTQAFFAPLGAYAAVHAVAGGLERNDSEGVIDNSVRVVQNSSAFINALLQITEFISVVSLKSSSSLSCIMQPILMIGCVATGLVVATIEAVLESRGIFRTTRFISTLRKNRESLGALETLRALKRDYLELSAKEQQDLRKAADKQLKKGSTQQQRSLLIDRLTTKRLEGKQHQLIRCTQAKFAHHLIKELDSLIIDLEQNHPNALKKANLLLDQAITQADKGRLMHFIGLFTSLFIVGALIAIQFAMPVLPALYFAIAVGFAILRYGIHVELFESFQWKFSLSHCIQKGLVTPIKEVGQSLDRAIKHLWQKTKSHRKFIWTTIEQSILPVSLTESFYLELIKNLYQFRKSPSTTPHFYTTREGTTSYAPTTTTAG
jgi:hypothetical protein